jgi:hypothetical protein
MQNTSSDFKHANRLLRFFLLRPVYTSLSLSYFLSDQLFTLFLTENRGRVANTPASNSGGPAFKSLETGYPKRGFSLVFLSPSKQLSGYHIELLYSLLNGFTINIVRYKLSGKVNFSSYTCKIRPYMKLKLTPQLRVLEKPTGQENSVF